MTEREVIFAVLAVLAVAMLAGIALGLVVPVPEPPPRPRAAGPAAWEVAEVIEEARRITREATE